MISFKRFNEISDGDWIKMSNADKSKKVAPKFGASAFEDKFKELKKKKDIEGLKKLRQTSQDAGHRDIVKKIDKFLK